MVIFNSLEDIDSVQKSVLSIGSFDGLHYGHQFIINKLTYLSKKYYLPSVVITFDPSPKLVLSGFDKKIKFITTMNKKIELFKSLGIDYLFIIKFDAIFSTIAAKIFFENYIISPFNPSHIVIGYDHQFGHKRKGDYSFLKKNENKYKYKLYSEGPILNKKNILSSTYIKSLIINGNIELVNKCLNRPFQIKGTVVKGNGIGKKINYPTANVELLDDLQLIPKDGVYSIYCDFDGQHYSGMCNIGKRPTIINNGKRIIEVHLFIRKKIDLYDKILIINFKKFIRKEKKFKNLSRLVKQLEIDKVQCLKEK